MSCKARELLSNSMSMPSVILSHTMPTSAPILSSDDNKPDAPIDWQALLDGLDGDEEFVRQLIILFVEDGQNSLQQIAAAVKAGDYVSLGAKAHSLKGSTANLLAEQARCAAEKLEHAAKESRTDQIPQLATNMQYELQRAMDYLSARLG